MSSLRPSRTNPDPPGVAAPRAPFLQAFLRRYAEAEAAAVAPFIVGRRVLDLGAGEAYVAASLGREGRAWVCSVDVGHFRHAAGPYVVYDGARLPFSDGAFDTALILLALHHCARPEAVLDEALRVTRRRLIVMESTYRNGLQRATLEYLDGRLNRLRHGGRMPPALGFRDPGGWQSLFASRGLRILEARWLGPWWERLVHRPLLFVLDMPTAPSRQAPMAPPAAAEGDWRRAVVYSGPSVVNAGEVEHGCA